MYLKDELEKFFILLRRRASQSSAVSDDISRGFPFTNWMLAATVGGIKPGCYKIGNTGGMMDNVIASKLYRRGSVGYVSKSGGMSNELNNIICNNTDGVYEGVAIGGDRYPGVCF